MDTNYERRQYVIFSISELDQVDFSQVLETSKDTVRKSIDGTLTFVKFESNMPSTVKQLTTKQGPYTHNEMLDILSTEQWTDINIKMQ